MRLDKYKELKINQISDDINDYFAFDIETTELNPFRGAKIFTYALATYCGEKIENIVIREGFKKPLQDFLNDTSKIKICQTFHYEYACLKENGFHIPDDTVWHDTMLMAKILKNNSYSYTLDKIYSRLFPGHPERNEYDDYVNTEGKKSGYHNVDKEIMKQYQIFDVERTLLIFMVMFEQIKKDKYLYECYLYEIEIVKITYAIEKLGVYLNVDNTKKLLIDIKRKYEKTVEETFDYLKVFVNLNSDKQLKKLLFVDMGFESIKKTKKGGDSTDKDTLYELKLLHPDEKIFDLIIKWRTYTNGLTVIQGYLDIYEKYGVINPGISTLEAITGRQAAHDPNIQNIQKPEGMKKLVPINSRSCFKVLNGYTWYFADYSGIEMMFIIEITGEPVMVKLLSEGKDVHAYAASLFFDDLFLNDNKCIDFFVQRNDPEKLKLLTDDEILKKAKKLLRDAAKNGQFALVYGAGLNRVATTINIPVELVKRGFNQYKMECPRIANFTRDSIDLVRKLGYIKSPFGKNMYPDMGAIYSIGNHRIQGAGAELLKRSEVRIDNYLKDQWDGEIKLSVPVHDELWFMVPNYLNKYEKSFRKDIDILMCEHKQIKNVKLKTEWKKTVTEWDKAVKIEN